MKSKRIRLDRPTVLGDNSGSFEAIRTPTEFREVYGETYVRYTVSPTDGKNYTSSERECTIGDFMNNIYNANALSVTKQELEEMFGQSIEIVDSEYGD